MSDCDVRTNLALLTRDWLTPVVFVNTDEVNLDDLMRAGSVAGQIIRCSAPLSDCIKIYDFHGPEAFGYVAGMIGDE